MRIEAFSSSHAVDWVAQTFAEQMPDSSLAMLRAAGVSARYVPVPYYHPGEAGLPIVSKRGVFVPFTVSALGLRQLLARARALGEPFRIAYVRLERPAAEGDEAWRQRAIPSEEAAIVLREVPHRGKRVYNGPSPGNQVLLRLSLWFRCSCSCGRLIGRHFVVDGRIASALVSGSGGAASPGSSSTDHHQGGIPPGRLRPDRPP